MTANYHTPITASDNVSPAVINGRLGTLDAQLSNLSNDFGSFDGAISLARQEVNALDTLVRAYSLASGAVHTAVSGAAASAQKVVDVDSSTGFLVNDRVCYALAGGTIEVNIVGTVNSPTRITLTANIGAGGIADNAIVSVIPNLLIQAAQNMAHGGRIDPTIDVALQILCGKVYYPEAYGAVGDGAAHPLTDYYASVAAAQAYYPHADATSNQMDWMAIQAAISACPAWGVVKLMPTTYIMGMKGLTFDEPKWLDMNGATLQFDDAFSGSAMTWAPTAAMRHFGARNGIITQDADNHGAYTGFKFDATNARMLYGEFFNINIVRAATPFLFTGPVTAGKSITQIMFIDCNVRGGYDDCVLVEANTQLYGVYWNGCSFETLYGSSTLRFLNVDTDTIEDLNFNNCQHWLDNAEAAGYTLTLFDFSALNNYRQQVVNIVGGSWQGPIEEFTKAGVSFFGTRICDAQASSSGTGYAHFVDYLRYLDSHCRDFAEVDADRWTASGAGVTLAADASFHLGQRVALLTTPAGITGTGYRNLANNDEWIGVPITFAVWVKTDKASTIRATIVRNGATYTYSNYHPGDDAWHLLNVSYTPPAGTTTLAVSILANLDAGSPTLAYISQPMLRLGTVSAFYPQMRASDGPELTGTDDITVDTLADGAAISATIAVIGARLGDVAVAALPEDPTDGVIVTAHVSASNAVRVTVMNHTGGNLTLNAGAAMAARVAVWRY